MKKLRYMIFDTVGKRYLRQVTVLDDDTRLPVANCVVTTWTRWPEMALKLPGIKSARAMVRRLGVDRLAIVNGKKDIVG